MNWATELWKWDQIAWENNLTGKNLIWDLDSNLIHSWQWVKIKGSLKRMQERDWKSSNFEISKVAVLNLPKLKTPWDDNQDTCLWI